MTRGLVIGKFYPPHRGHSHLIDTARAQCDHLTVIVCWKKTQTIPGPLRAEWIRTIHPGVTVIVVDDDHMDDNDSEGWARYTRETLGYAPDIVFTSEDYGEPYAAFLGARHVLVDKERVTVPISGTAIRAAPHTHAAYLAPCVRAYFMTRICVLGAESTGTTTLARGLAAHYGTVWVPEYGRTYAEGKVAGGIATWESDEFVHIARAQAALEDALAPSGNRYVIADTDAFATGVWHERYMGTRSDAVESFAATRHYALYILTGDEIPFVQDGLRDGEHIRHAMHQRFIERLTEEKLPFILVTGGKDERLARAIAAIDALGEVR